MSAHPLKNGTICREAIRIALGRLRGSKVEIIQSSGTQESQRHIDFVVKDADLEESLDEFSRKWIQPAMTILMASLGKLKRLTTAILDCTENDAVCYCSDDLSLRVSSALGLDGDKWIRIDIYYTAEI